MVSRSLLPTVRTALVPVALVGMLAIPGLVLGRIYSGDLLPRLLIVAALASVLISVLVRRLPAWCAAPASVFGLAALLVLAVRLSAQAGDVQGGLPDLTRDALRGGVPRLLTAMIPIEPQPDTVVVPVIATWLAGLTAAELALRNRRILLSYAAPTVLFGGALYLVGPNATPLYSLPIGFAACAAVGLAASAYAPVSDRAPAGMLSPAQRAALRIRLAAGAAAGLALIIALATAVGPSVAGSVGNTPVDPRRYVTPPQLDSLDESPLVRISGWMLNPDQHLFDASVTGAKSARIRLAVMSDYDGVTWKVGATYRDAGRVLTGPPADAQVTAGKRVEERITIADLDGRLLPGAAVPQEVDGVRIAYDQATGTMAYPDGLRPGLSYTVVSKIPQPNVNLEPDAEVPTGPSVARYTVLPGAEPADLGQLAQQLGSGIVAPFQKASAIEDWLATHYTYVTDAPSGHAYPNLDFFLFGPRNAGGQKGTSEQFAAAFAVLARALGLPARVCVGFDVSAGTSAVKGRNAIAWPEVLFNGLGWLAFDPIPQSDNPRPVEEDFKPQANQSVPPPVDLPTPAVSHSATPSARPSAATAAATGPSTAVLALAAASTVAAFMMFYVVWVIGSRRRLRRRRLELGDPGSRVTGAWSEVLDGLRLAGRPAAPHLAATEVASYAVTTGHTAHTARGVRAPAPPVDELALLANQVAFIAPGTGGLDAARVARATTQAVTFVGDLRGRRPWWGRLLWTLDPRPLVWDRRRSRRRDG